MFARRAGVGKGTVYLYWPSKLYLFGTVLARDAAELLGEQLAALRPDPAEVRLHRAMRRSALLVMG
ncbi:MAG: TetR family transcriptional regulator [Actinomycetota bacterium]|nr:TetR family transcriptional regulator [Actinomycetota bacterium]MDQ3901191.1 TetR family transcriptional regulator [Actinomycetota bacterium]